MTLESLVLHPTTRLLLNPFRNELPHALLLYGREGVGLFTISNSLGAGSIVAIVQPKNVKGDIDPSGTISVDTIRQLYEQTRAKRTGRNVVIVDGADRMSHGAQSAFLKLLEEPNAGMSFILTSHQRDKLLPTILSRLQEVRIQQVTAEQTLALITTLGQTDQVKRIQLRYIAEGLPAELYRLIHDDGLFASKAAIVTDARDFLQASDYAKALIVQKYKGDRLKAIQLLDGAIAILRKTLSAKPEARVIHQMQLLLEVKERVQANCNVALQLMRFVL